MSLYCWLHVDRPRSYPAGFLCAGSLNEQKKKLTPPPQTSVWLLSSCRGSGWEEAADVCDTQRKSVTWVSEITSTIPHVQTSEESQDAKGLRDPSFHRFHFKAQSFPAPPSVFRLISGETLSMKSSWSYCNMFFPKLPPSWLESQAKRKWSSTSADPLKAESLNSSLICDVTTETKSLLQTGRVAWGSLECGATSVDLSFQTE